MNFKDYDLFIVGSGFYGLTIAQQAAGILGLRVLILEKRPHIGGNAWSSIDPETGIEVHNYGSHLFHCNSQKIWDYLNHFTPFTDYRHRVFTAHSGHVYPMPINLDTICRFYGKFLTPDEARRLIDTHREDLLAERAGNVEDRAIALIGRPLYEAFIKGYTIKQWQTDPKLLPASIITRLPVRYNFNSRYFNDKYEGLPARGYAELFKKMIANPNISIRFNVDFFDIRNELPKDTPIIYTGPIDRYFNYKLGELSWRTLDFEREVHDTGDFQGCAVMNYADEDVPYTRVHEFRHLHPERNYQENKTVIFREYSRFAKAGDEPYYPIATDADQELYRRYESLAEQEKNTIFGGRLGTYRYLDMHQAIGAAFKVFENQLIPYFLKQKPLMATE